MIKTRSLVRGIGQIGVLLLLSAGAKCGILPSGTMPSLSPASTSRPAATVALPTTVSPGIPPPFPTTVQQETVTGETSGALTMVTGWNLGPTNRTGFDHNYFDDMAWSPNNGALAITTFGDNMGLIVVYDVSLPEPLWSAETGLSYSIEFSPDGDILAAGNIMPGLIQLWNGRSGHLDLEIEGNGCRVGTFLAFYPDKKTMLTGYDVGAGGENPTTFVNSWDLESGQCTGEVIRTDGLLRAFGVDRARQWAVAAVLNVQAEVPEQVEVWDLPTRQRICAFPGTIAALSRENGTIAVFGDDRRRIEIWTVAGCRLLNSFRIDMKPVSADISFDGQMLALGGDGLQLWDVVTGVKLDEFDEVMSVMGVAFSPNGHHLATVSSAPPGGRTRVSLWALAP